MWRLERLNQFAARRAEPTDLERRKAVHEPPPEQRAAVALFYFEGLSISETAIAVDIPDRTRIVSEDRDRPLE